MRPFAFKTPEDSYTGNNYGGSALLCGINAGITFPVILPSIYALRSTGNSKVYFIKPIIHNARASNLPIFQSEMFFAWTENNGVVDGDIVAISGSSTKYLVKGLASPDYATKLLFAIKYVA